MIWFPQLLDTMPEITRLPGLSTPPDWYANMPILFLGILCFAIGFIARGFFRER